ncbi:MAG: hypothetical protein AAF438_21395 [Pseudomonadota bacterium]
MSKRIPRSKFHNPSILFSLILMLAMTSTNAQTIDYDLNQATRTVKEVGSGLERLRPGDVASYNRLSAKLNKAAKHLESTQSKSHADYTTTVKRWGELQAQMAAIAQQWNAAAAQQQSEAQAAAAQAAAQQQAEAEAAAAAQAAAAQQRTQSQTPAPQPQQAAVQPQVEPVNLDPIMDKYQRQNLPKLSDTATPDEARNWATHMKGLQTTTLQADLATIESALNSGAASQSDADRVSRWISDMFQDNISRTINEKIQVNKGTISSMIYSADLINAVADGDLNGAYRFAGDEKFENNATRLDNAVRAGAVADVLDEIFGGSDNARGEQIRKIKTARARLDELLPAAKQQAERFANAPKAGNAANKDFLAPVAQKFWLNGDVMAESDKEGGIWMSGDNVGDITNNGEIWVQANERGSLEPNGEVWFGGNQVGSLEDNGEIWRNGNQVGLIDKQGKVWINGSADGEIEPFQGEWKRAAILYYFSDYFR